MRSEDRRAPLTWASIPPDYDIRIRTVRQDLGLSQARFADLVGAAQKAVVYQWESRKRCPSPVFWLRIEGLRPAGALSTEVSSKPSRVQVSTATSLEDAIAKPQATDGAGKHKGLLTHTKSTPLAELVQSLP